MAAHAYYLNNLFREDQRKVALKKARMALRGKKFDAILIPGGVSGIFGAILANAMRKQLVVARKPKDGTHSSYLVENIAGAKRMVFVDDLCSTGHTFKHCIEEVKCWRDKPTEGKIIGAYFYDAGTGFVDPDWIKDRHNIEV
jgi:adenine/guanine phosphoribosyltransferase-like PRPP-binding protein